MNQHHAPSTNVDLSVRLPPGCWLLSQLDREHATGWTQREFTFAITEFIRLADTAITAFADPISEQRVMPNSAELVDSLSRWQNAVDIAACALEAAERGYPTAAHNDTSNFDRINDLAIKAGELEQFTQALAANRITPTRDEIVDLFASISQPLRECATRLSVIFSPESMCIGPPGASASDDFRRDPERRR